MILSERRRPVFTAELLMRVGLIWLIVSAIFVISNLRAISGMTLPGAESAVLAVQPDYLPGGALAERIATVIVPLLTMGAAMLLAGRIAWRLFDSELIFYTALTLALAIPFTAQFQPLRFDHHGLQIVGVLAALNGLTARSARYGGWAAGAALGLVLGASLELLPIAILFGLILTLRWLAQPSERGWLVHFLWAVTLTSLIAFPLSHGTGDLSDRSGMASGAFIAGSGIAALGASLLCLVPRIPRLPLLLALGLVGVAALGASMALVQQGGAEPFAEARSPIWSYRPDMIAQMTVPPLIGLIAALRLHLQSCAWLQRFWLEYSLLLCGALLMSIFDARASGLACALAAVPLAWQLRRWLRLAQKMRGPVARVPAFSAMALAVMPGLPLMAIASLSAS